VLSIVGGAILVVVNPAGPVHKMDTTTGTFTAGINSTLQVKFCEDPATISPTGRIIVTETGGGTKK
jgi:hypothetical protein